MAAATLLEAPLSPGEFQTAARAALTRPPAGVDPWFHGYHGDLLDDRGRSHPALDRGALSAARRRADDLARRAGVKRGAI